MQQLHQLNCRHFYSNQELVKKIFEKKWVPSSNWLLEVSGKAILFLSSQNAQWLSEGRNFVKLWCGLNKAKFKLAAIGFGLIHNCRAVTSPKKGTDKFVFLSWRLENTWNLNFYFKFQVFPSCQDRKTNSSVYFLVKLWLDNFVLRSTDL